MFTRRLYILAGSFATAISLFALILGASRSGQVNAQGADSCSLKTIKGTWVFEARGVVVDGGTVVPYAEAGVWTLDGAGKATGIFSASMNGVTIATQKPLTATYALKPGCVFTAVDSEGLLFDLYPINQGTSMTYFTAGVSGTQFKK
jgi:hypothetical protein